MAEIRLFTGDAPPEDPQTGMVWTEIQPGSGRWVELPESFVTAEGAEAPASGDWTSIMKQAQAARSKMPLWVWPGIPLAIAGFKLVRWLLVKGKKA